MLYKLSKQKLDNVSSRIIAGQNTASIVTDTGVSKYTVLRMKKKIDPNYPRHLGERPSFSPLSAHTATDLKLRTGHVTSIRGVQTYLRRLGFSVASFTARNFLMTLGFKCCIKKNKAALSFQQIKRRLKWAGEHRRRLSFRTKVDLIAGALTVLLNIRIDLGVIHYDHTNIRPENICFGHHIPRYIALLWLELQHDDVIFQQDGATCHTSDPTYNWMDNKGKTYISDWPPNSPDLNPIEHLWRHVKLCLDKYPLKASSPDKLWERYYISKFQASNAIFCEDLFKYWFCDAVYVTTVELSNNQEGDAFASGDTYANEEEDYNGNISQDDGIDDREDLDGSNDVGTLLKVEVLMWTNHKYFTLNPEARFHDDSAFPTEPAAFLILIVVALLYSKQFAPTRA